jgi:membrane associated rhomboid family serine protease
MGIYDREYYRSDGPSFFRSLYETGRVCKWLIGINIAVFVIQLITRGAGAEDTLGWTGGWFTDFFDLNTWQVLHGEVWRLVTHAFLHSPSDPLHIIFNMLFLWWFGNEIEEMYGSREFLTLYLTAAVLGGLAFVGWDVLTIPYGELNLASPALGASGAVTAVLVLYACHFPTRTIRLFYFLPIPVWLFVVLEVGLDAYRLLGGNADHIAVQAHLGGAAFAFLYYKRQWRLMGLWSWLRSRKVSRPRLRVYREEEAPAGPRAPVGVATAPKPDVDEHLEAKLDQVLEKVARFGQDSLTESERQILFRASEVYKRRRT